MKKRLPHLGLSFKAVALVVVITIACGVLWLSQFDFEYSDSSPPHASHSANWEEARWDRHNLRNKSASHSRTEASSPPAAWQVVDAGAAYNVSPVPPVEAVGVRLSESVRTRQIGEKMTFTVPQNGAVYTGLVERLEQVGRTRSYSGTLSTDQEPSGTFVITIGERNTFATLATPRGGFELVAKDRLAWIAPASRLEERYGRPPPNYYIPREMRSMADTPGDGVDLVCPCVARGNGETIRVQFGVRNYGFATSKRLRLAVNAVLHPGRILELGYTEFAENGVGAGSLGRFVVSVPINWKVPFLATTGTDRGWSHELEIELQEPEGDGFVSARGIRRMDGEVDLLRPFRIGDVDYLADGDGDYIGDLNEKIAGTDPADSESVPNGSVVDVLAFYSASVPKLYGGDPIPRIRHAFAQMNESLHNSGVPLRARIVGVLPVDIDEGSSTPPDVRVMVDEGKRHGADMLAVFRLAENGPGCGWAINAGWKRYGDIPFGPLQMTNPAFVGVECPNDVLAHELGHVMGLGHSFWQNESGTWRWSRGLGVADDFQTIMSYGLGDGVNSYLFSSPHVFCTGHLSTVACGVDRHEFDGADAVTTLGVTRFQVSNYRPSLEDADGDGFVDPVDQFPETSDEWWDADQDGEGDNADADDDNDGVDDVNDEFPFDPSESVDEDGDGVGDNADGFLGNADEWADLDEDGVGDNADLDDDGDGVDDVDDVFPKDRTKHDLGSWVFHGANPGDSIGRAIESAGDIDGDGRPELLIGAPEFDYSGIENSGAVYVVSTRNLATLDALDGESDRLIDLGNVVGTEGSWLIVGESVGDRVGTSLAAGDIDADDVQDVVIGAPGSPSAEGNQGGSVYVLSGSGMSDADAEDGIVDGVIMLDAAVRVEGSWKLTGDYEDSSSDSVGVAIACGDRDGDGLADLLIGGTATFFEWNGSGSAWYLAASSLLAADGADGEFDGDVSLEVATQQGYATRFITDGREALGTAVALGGVKDGNALGEIIIGTGSSPASAVYIVDSGVSERTLDAMDGVEDGIVHLDDLVGQSGVYRLISLEFLARTNGVWTGGDLNDDGESDFFIGGADSVYIVWGGGLQRLDAADGFPDGHVMLNRLGFAPYENGWIVGGSPHVARNRRMAVNGREMLFGAHVFGGAYLVNTSQLPSSGGSWPLTWDDPGPHWSFHSPWHREDGGGMAVAFIGDVDGDSLTDIAIAAPDDSTWMEGAGVVYLALRGELEAMDRVGGNADNVIGLNDFAGDYDGDGLLNSKDRDDDDDGYEDHVDAFPLDETRWEL